MLFLLTGNRQVGKTRLLERLLSDAQASGIRCVGVLTPGVWEPKADGSLEKKGIDALLLPQGDTLPFAVRRDLADDGAPSSDQSDSAKLGWRIFDDAVDAINAHLDELERDGIGKSDILVIDELGTLELVREQGLTSALRLLDEPPSDDPASGMNAVVVVRPELIDVAKKRFAPVWGEPLLIDASEVDAYLGIASLIRSFNSVSDKS